MIFFADNSGTIIRSVPSPVYQGSANTNNVYLVAPFAVNAAVTVAFTLPNGERVGPYTMTAESALEGIRDAEGRTYAGWAFSMPNAVTAYYGVVGMQFYFYAAANGALTATSLTSFEVKRGVAPVLPEAPDADVYAAILAALAQLQSDLGNGVYVARAVFPWQSTATYGYNEIVFYPDEGEYGAFVISQQAGNTGNAPYINGVLNGAWWKEVVNFNTVTEDFFMQVKNAQEEAEHAAANAQEAAASIQALVGKQVQFVSSEAEMTKSNVLYGVVEDNDANLFSLYMVENGVPEKVGSANLVINVTRYYGGILSANGWSGNAQTVYLSDVAPEGDVTVEPINEDAASYITNGVMATALVEGGIQFTCATVPDNAITLVVAVTKAQEIPDANGYYTKPQIDAQNKQLQDRIEFEAQSLNDEIAARQTADMALGGRIDAIEDGTKNAGVATTAEKVKNALTVTVNGAAVTYNGSAAKSVVINTEGGFASVLVTIAPSQWSGGSVTLTQANYAALAAVVESSLVQFYAADESAAAVVENNVRITAQGTASVTISADTAPAASISAVIIVFN